MGQVIQFGKVRVHFHDPHSTPFALASMTHVALQKLLKDTRFQLKRLQDGVAIVQVDEKGMYIVCRYFG
jgi:hypothetical protein